MEYIVNRPIMDNSGNFFVAATGYRADGVGDAIFEATAGSGTFANIAPVSGIRSMISDNAGNIYGTASDYIFRLSTTTHTLTKVLTSSQGPIQAIDSQEN